MKLENPLEEYSLKEITAYERFWSKVNIPDNFNDCWNWTAYKTPKTSHNRLGGYGQFKVHGKIELSHRIAYQFAIGNIPKNMFVLHKCDNPSCCNPNHLCVGDQVLNVKYMWERNRANPGHVYGEKHGCAKLNEQDIIEIRILSSYLYSNDIAKLYDVSGRTIRYIISGQHWKHLVEEHTISIKVD